MMNVWEEFHYLHPLHVVIVRGGIFVPESNDEVSSSDFVNVDLRRFKLSFSF